MNITLRKAVMQDSENILTWRNEATTIPWMGTRRPLSREEHETWFFKTLSDPKNVFFIIEANDVPSGQIRYVLVDNKTSKVSINITQKMHGKGIASFAFRKGSELVRELGFSENIFAYVLPDNVGSIRAMEKAGYVKGEMVEVHSLPHLVMLDNLKTSLPCEAKL